MEGGGLEERGRAEGAKGRMGGWGVEGERGGKRGTGGR